MLKSACALVTILSLLACPLSCMGDAAAVSEDETATPCSCCCGHDPLQQGNDQSSEEPSAPCDPCVNCVCHGAVVTKDDVNLGTDAPADALLLEAQGPAVAALAVPKPAVWGGDDCPPGARSGRLIRYELQSLLL